MAVQQRQQLGLVTTAGLTLAGCHPSAAEQRDPGPLSAGRAAPATCAAGCAETGPANAQLVSRHAQDAGQAVSLKK